MNQTIRVLLIDDNPDDRLLAIRELKREFPELQVEQVAEAKGFDQALATDNFEVVITDYQLRWTDGITVVRTIKARYPDLPIVMFTNSGDEEVAVEGMKAGLDDYVLKSPKHYFRLPVAVRSALEQAQQHEALKEAENRYSSLFNGVPVGLYRMAPRGEILDANPALVELLGYSDRQALLAVKAVDMQADTEAWRQWHERMERDDVVRNFEMRIRTKEGRMIWVRHNARVVRDRKGKVLYYEGAIEDVTLAKQVEEERRTLLALEQKARAAAEAANLIKDEFLATLSHELRTPLNAMLGWANLLRTRKVDEATAARALETIERNAKAQNQMISDLLDVSRIIRGQLRLTVHPVDLMLVIEAALDTVRLTAAAKAVTLETVYAPLVVGAQGKGALVMGDSDRLQQVVWNLLTNSIKFTPAGGRVEVRLSVVSDQLQWTIDNLQPAKPNYAQLQISDTGQGISADFLPYLFDRFRQADSTITRSHGGLGLGLAIVRQLVELHGGTIHAHSPGIGQGATFTVQLPLLEGSRELEVGSRKPSNHSPLATSLKGLHIVVVDDEADTRDVLTIALEEYGATVTAAASAVEAISAIAQSQPDVLISDIGMPKEDGYTLIRKLREQGIQLPAVALTAYASEQDRKQAIAAGFQMHVAKPIDPEELIAAVAHLATINC